MAESAPPVALATAAAAQVCFTARAKMSFVYSFTSENRLHYNLTKFRQYQPHRKAFRLTYIKTLLACHHVMVYDHPDETACSIFVAIIQHQQLPLTMHQRTQLNDRYKNPGLFRGQTTSRGSGRVSG